jgi:hypothetical protein
LPRPRVLPLNGVRRTITLPPELDEQLAILGVKRRIPVSVILQEIIAKGLDAMSAGRDGHRAKAAIPAGWDGRDLQDRLLDIRMRQTELAGQLGVKKSTLGSWINGTHPWPEGTLEQVRQALVSWDPAKGKFRWGSKSRKP